MSRLGAERQGATTATGGGRIVPRNLPPAEKAAVIVRLLLAEGSSLPLSALPEHMQAALTEQIGRMRLVDRVTLGAVVEEFVNELEQVGLSFPGGIEGAISMMDGHISTTAANRLRRLAGVAARSDPWDRIVQMPPERLLPVLAEESVEVGAVILSRLPAARSADLLARVPPDRARSLALAMSLTGNVAPDTVARIGQALLTQLDNQPDRAFEAGPVERVGAILNVSAAATRDEVLRGLADSDQAFAEQVRRAIFTFVHIPARLSPRDVPKVLRQVDQAVLVTALAAAMPDAEGAAAVDFLLANMSQRMAQTLREEMAERGKVKQKDGEEAMNAVIAGIRTLETSGELALIAPDDEG
ncbi:flagellar motor switch protein FliG [Aliigemmobacter aestuarii]|uniref:Flagellar motor switch protein FliG n=1 Tax=Aliigemmobacter aestuarii TaxID=1445661 RepID=A0A4S3MUH0_9RHOB|nr:flagellar motor switch protein FliG [Gemmobacter aestuarii]